MLQGKANENFLVTWHEITTQEKHPIRHSLCRVQVKRVRVKRVPVKTVR